MIIRVGIQKYARRMAELAVRLGAPVLISANNFWKRGKFRLPQLPGDIALDSAGFTTMKCYGGYIWPLADYVKFAGALRPTWWAAPDYCCEPEIAHDRIEVGERVCRTAASLEMARQAAADQGVEPPMPVLQGWQPDDYVRCADLMPDLPPLVGVGSVCRRNLSGGDGILRVVNRLDLALDPAVKLHLFGVKGLAIRALAGHPRIYSMDSMAWDYAARRALGHAHVGKPRRGAPSHHMPRADFLGWHLQRWWQQQNDGLGLFGRPAVRHVPLPPPSASLAGTIAKQDISEPPYSD